MRTHAPAHQILRGNTTQLLKGTVLTQLPVAQLRKVLVELSLHPRPHCYSFMRMRGSEGTQQHAPRVENTFADHTPTSPQGQGSKYSVFEEKEAGTSAGKVRSRVRIQD